MPHAVRHQLRNTDPRHDMSGLLPADVLDRVMAAHYRPTAIMLLLGQWVRRNARTVRSMPGPCWPSIAISTPCPT
jgi:putative membrane protein